MGGSELPLIGEAFASNYIAPCGPMVERFERVFAEKVGVPYACAVSSGTAALELLFHELGVERGDSVVCSDLTFVSSIAPAAHRGAEPIFVDCDPATWTLDPVLLEEALAHAKRGRRMPKAVVAVDLYGQCCDYERIEAICAAYGVPLIIDAAEALGAVYGSAEGLKCGNSKIERPETGGQRSEGSRAPANELINSRKNQPRSAGDAGWAAVYSFNGNKIITTSGGGMVASRDSGVVERARKRSQQAREPFAWYEHLELGFNHRMSNIVAAIGVGQLAHLDGIVAKKRQIFDWYCERLGGVGGLSWMPEAGYGRCTRWLSVVEISSKVLECGSSKVGESEAGLPAGQVMRVIEALERENIEARPVWKPMHLQPVFRGARVFGGGVSERFFRNGLCLPSGAGLTEDDVARVCSVVIGAL